MDKETLIVLKNYVVKLMRHKWYVFQAGRKLGVGLWQLIVHDLSKFKPSEFLPYARFWEGMQKQRPIQTESEYQLAWLSHLRSNPHHWQYWVLVKDDGTLSPQPMPKKYILEMVADWSGANKTYQSTWNPNDWYMERRSTMSLHPFTRANVEYLLRTYF